jgi:hypothetical protein
VVPPVAFGWQTPFVHVKPSAHGADAQLVRHWPFAQTFPSAHSLEYLQTFSGAVHLPATHESPPLQSLATVHGQGPAVPPHALHALSTQIFPSPQSDFVVHSTVFGGSLFVGEVQ